MVHDGADRLDEPVLKVIEAATTSRILIETAETYYVKVDPTAAEGTVMRRGGYALTTSRNPSQNLPPGGSVALMQRLEKVTPVAISRRDQ